MLITSIEREAQKTTDKLLRQFFFPPRHRQSSITGSPGAWEIIALKCSRTRARTAHAIFLTRLYHARPDTMTEISFRVHWPAAPSTYIRDTRLSSWISNYAALSEMHIRTILRIPWIRGTYNMSHGRVSTLFPPLSLDIPRLPFSRPHVHRARARVSRSQCLVRQVSRASSCSTKCSLADPNFSSFPPTPRIGRAKSLWSACRINVAFYEHSRSQDNIFGIYYLRKKSSPRHCIIMFLHDTFGIER